MCGRFGLWASAAAAFAMVGCPQTSRPPTRPTLTFPDEARHEAFAALSVGTSTAEVRARLGAPDDVRTSGDGWPDGATRAWAYGLVEGFAALGIVWFDTHDRILHALSPLSLPSGTYQVRAAFPFDGRTYVQSAPAEFEIT